MNLRDATGAGTVTVLGFVFAVLVLVSAIIALAHAGISAARAATAADLAALAASDTARGLMLGDPCATADTTATAHGAHLVSCQVQDGGVVYIQTEVPTRIGNWAASAETRAGPPPPSNR